MRVKKQFLLTGLMCIATLVLSHIEWSRAGPETQDVTHIFDALSLKLPAAYAQGECVYQSPFADGAPFFSHINSIGEGKDPNYYGFHQVEAWHWPGVDTNYNLRPIWTNGAKVIYNPTWHDSDGLIALQGIGPCSGDVFISMHHNTRPPFDEGSTIDANTSYGGPGRRGDVRGDDHNHVLLCRINEQPSWFNIPVNLTLGANAYYGYCFHPENALAAGSYISSQQYGMDDMSGNPDQDAGGGVPPMVLTEQANAPEAPQTNPAQPNNPSQEELYQQIFLEEIAKAAAEQGLTESQYTAKFSEDGRFGFVIGFDFVHDTGIAAATVANQTKINNFLLMLVALILLLVFLIGISINALSKKKIRY